MKANHNSAQIEILLDRVRKREKNAFDDLLEMYDPLVRAEVAHYTSGLDAFDVDDFRQVAWLALYRASLSFDLSQSKVEFGLYAKICISNALSSFLRAWLINSKTELPVPDEWLAEWDDGEGDPAHLLMEEEAVQLLRARIRKVLSPFENCVWNLYMAGCSAKKIGRALGKEPHSIENAVYRIRRKLRAELRSGD
ncbi:MAG: sigma-70 family RNA polymerase sigma factor [Clostridia bacterium]|nr:sigma-70 family RNA polymerase sigma factor [Clostridia bacterium]MBQ8716812.1 sigma-70 family RNA polymerase sigma factor [Clostridia bacterium]